MVTSRCRTQPRTHISSLIAGHYSDRLLARQACDDRDGARIERGSGWKDSASVIQPSLSPIHKCLNNRMSAYAQKPEQDSLQIG